MPHQLYYLLAPPILGAVHHIIVRSLDTSGVVLNDLPNHMHEKMRTKYRGKMFLGLHERSLNRPLGHPKMEVSFVRMDLLSLNTFIDLRP